MSKLFHCTEFLFVAAGVTQQGENKDYNCLYGPNENNEENEYGSRDNDFGQPDFDVPESADANENVTQHAEKVG